MEYLGSFAYLLLLVFMVCLVGAVVWLIFYYSWKAWKDFRKN